MDPFSTRSGSPPSPTAAAATTASSYVFHPLQHSAMISRVVRFGSGGIKDWHSMSLISQRWHAFAHDDALLKERAPRWIAHAAVDPPQREQPLRQRQQEEEDEKQRRQEEGADEVGAAPAAVVRVSTDEEEEEKEKPASPSSLVKAIHLLLEHQARCDENSDWCGGSSSISSPEALLVRPLLTELLVLIRHRARKKIMREWRKAQNDGNMASRIQRIAEKAMFTFDSELLPDLAQADIVFKHAECEDEKKSDADKSCSSSSSSSSSSSDTSSLEEKNDREDDDGAGPGGGSSNDDAAAREERQKLQMKKDPYRQLLTIVRAVEVMKVKKEKAWFELLLSISLWCLLLFTIGFIVLLVLVGVEGKGSNSSGTSCCSVPNTTSIPWPFAGPSSTNRTQHRIWNYTFYQSYCAFRENFDTNITMPATTPLTCPTGTSSIPMSECANIHYSYSDALYAIIPLSLLIVVSIALLVYHVFAGVAYKENHPGVDLMAGVFIFFFGVLMFMFVMPRAARHDGLVEASCDSGESGEFTKSEIPMVLFGDTPLLLLLYRVIAGLSVIPIAFGIFFLIGVTSVSRLFRDRQNFLLYWGEVTGY